MIHYTPSFENDAILVTLWAKIVSAGDHERLFPEESRNLNTFFAMAAPPRSVLIAVSERIGPWFAAWIRPEMSGVNLGVWIAPERRHTRLALRLFLQVCQDLLAHHRVIFSITKQRSLLKLHERLGYAIHGPIPHLFDGEPAWVVSLTRESLEVTLCRLRTKAKSSVRPGSALAEAPPPPLTIS